MHAKHRCHDGGAVAAADGPCMRRAACGHAGRDLVSLVPGVVPTPVTVIQVYRGPSGGTEEVAWTGDETSDTPAPCVSVVP